jgi:hypothetical protein
MMAKRNDSRIKNEDQYRALRDQGMPKSKAARIANADVDHDARPYENRTKKELYDQARKLKIDGRSNMNKDELIKALRKR